MPQVEILRLLSGFFLKKDHRFEEARPQILNAVERLHSPDMAFDTLPVSKVHWLMRHSDERTINYRLSDDYCSLERDFQDDFNNFRDLSLRLVRIYREHFNDLKCHRTGIVIYFKMTVENETINFLEGRFLQNIGSLDKKKEAEIRVSHELPFKKNKYEVTWKLVAKEQEIEGSLDLGQRNTSDSGFEDDAIRKIEEHGMKYFNETFVPYISGE